MRTKIRIILLECGCCFFFVCALAWQLVPFDRMLGWKEHSFPGMMADKAIVFVLAVLTVLLGIRLHLKARALAAVEKHRKRTKNTAPATDRPQAL